MAAIKNGYGEFYELAEYFDLPEELVKKACEYYQAKTPPTENTSSVSDEPSATEESSKEEPEAPEAKDETTYQSILDDYTKQLKDAAPLLVEEFNTEAAEAKGDVNALAELSNAKIAELAKISTTGVEKMAKIMLTNGDDEATYSDWAGKLNDVYMEQAQQITDAYMSTATGQ